MPTYQYVARAADGRVVNGTAEASDQQSVVQMLREKGLMPTSIKVGGGVKKAGAKRRKGKGGRTKLDDLVIFSQQMAVMIRAGLPLIEVLDILAEQTERRSLAAVVRQVEKDVEAGESLTEAMVKHSNVFNTFYLSMIKAGEASGMLDSTLEQVAVYLERTASLQRKIKMATMYPATVSFIAIVITIFLLIKVVPVFGEIFSDLGGTLPFPTRVVLFASGFVQDKWWLLLGAAFLFWLFLWQYGKTKQGRYNLDSIKLKIPIFGPLFLKTAVARFARTLSTLIRSGVNILYALDIVAKTAGNARMEAAVIKTKASIQSGESLTKPLADSNVFPPMVTRMIDVGEKTGALESMLTKIADFYEDQVSTAVAGLTSLIEPLLIVFLGVVVGFIVIAMFMPMFKMIELLS
ncbi:MAG: type pilus assembly protein PilC [Candidatus Sumerlaeota bacterium]|nr:type pilus assembly protein PilC [Candidatus Sumerlaeota bacterium]